jgi:hypothetical protein
LQDPTKITQTVIFGFKMCRHLATLDGSSASAETLKKANFPTREKLSHKQTS